MILGVPLHAAGVVEIAGDGENTLSTSRHEANSARKSFVILVEMNS